ncbi:uncharacterized protein BO88DRAFT_430259 [Aspergillus vadensis CBS 113365]|uniref:Uncharacterized protein n=1 Tax=Aspergillus vadensis (strain CBS 113365 / IMI 142717 / IBT 24658) TaxID=1448311 RepID=A0A319BBN7_ASPVC|nr:hypothetical protein BO88DRAFT_430259 [Aspergillus vadensis CBS 113365]PYH63603.1 hypothetical protein BO88DRAFT_430259 [Aspergillus vadensis CBS 113365]
MVVVLSSLRPKLRPNAGRLRRGIDWDRVIADGESEIDEKQALDHRPQTRRPSGRPAAVCDMASFTLELFWLQLRPAKKCHFWRAASNLVLAMPLRSRVKLPMIDSFTFSALINTSLWLHRWGLQSETHPLAEFTIHMYQRPTKLFF